MFKSLIKATQTQIIPRSSALASFRKFSSKHTKEELEAEEKGAIPMRIYSIAILLPLGLFVEYALFIKEEPHSVDKKMPFANKRYKPFPWSDGDTSMFSFGKAHEH